MTPTPPTILIVDDEPLNRRLLEALLQPEGYRTLAAESGEEALALVAKHAPDLILLDIMMPGMDGYAVACRLKADPETASIPIVMVTAQIDRSARLRGLDAGAEDFLLKPVDRAELSLRVRNHLRLKVDGDIVRDQASALAEEVQTRSADLERFRSAMDTTADAIFLTSRTTMRLVEVNATATKMLGYSREEFLSAGALAVADAVAGRLEATFDALIAGDHTKDIVETQIRRRDGTMLPVEIHLHAQRSGEDWIIVSVMSDMTARKEAEGRLHRLAHYDAVTHLPNRTLFYETLDKTVAMAGERGWVVSVLFIDVDHFKNVNDTLGHETGDLVLRELGDRLLGCLRVRDTIGRLGGDEFAAIVVTEDDGKNAAIVAAKVQHALSVPFELKGREVALTASIGIAVFPADATDPATLVKYADTAMYRAKEAGRNTARFFTAQMNTEIVAREALEVALKEAIAMGQFVLHYQPKVDVHRGTIVGVEALLRWNRPGIGLVSPADFIPALEETGLIREVGRWVIERACGQIAEWKRSGVGPVPVAVNVSGRQFLDGTLDAIVLEALARHDVAPTLLELELTESSLMDDTAQTVASLRNLKGLGVRVSIDDFGTGYSSLAYLSRFPIDTLKIDIAFVRHITRSAEDAAIARAVISLGHSLQMNVVAEGVETDAQLAYLRQHGCDQIQGYLFSRPVPPDELGAMVRAGRPFEAARHPPSTGYADLVHSLDAAHVVLDTTGAVCA